MDPIWLLLLLPLAAASGWLSARSAQKPPRAKHNIPEAYFKGLSFLLNERPDKALQVFMEAVEVDNETIEMHLALGNLFRRRGEVERATRIHQNIVARSDIEKRLRTQALFELAQDYFKAGLFDRAENLFQELRLISEYQEQACQFLLQIFDQEKEWSSAILVVDELSKTTDSDYSDTLAQYFCELVEKSLSEGKNSQAKNYLASAFRHNPHCVRAVIQSGRLASIQSKHREAINIWKSLEHWSPQSISEVVDHLANSYSEINDYSGYQIFLKSAIKKSPDTRLISELIQLVESEEGKEASQRLLLEMVRKYPSLKGLYELMKAQTISGISSRENEDYRILAGLLSKVISEEKEYSCRQCGYSSRSIQWQCPGCKGWSTVQRNTNLALLSLEKPAVDQSNQIFKQTLK